LVVLPLNVSYRYFQTVTSTVTMAVCELLAEDFGLVEELHRSSGGSVYLGRSRRTGEHVILKVRRALARGAPLRADHGPPARLRSD
jgi:hypothetical protein